MAAALYPTFLEKLLDGTLNINTGNIKAALIDQAAETYNAADVFLTDVTGAAIIGTSPNLASKTFTLGVFDAADSTVTAVTGASIEAVILYVDTGTAATSRLIGYFDGLNLTPNGSDVLIQWPNGASKIFAL